MIDPMQSLTLSILFSEINNFSQFDKTYLDPVKVKIYNSYIVTIL